MERIKIVQRFFENRLLHSLRTKLIFSFLAFSIIPLAAVVTLAYVQFQGALRSLTSNQLIVVRDLKIKQVETYLRQIEQDIKLVAELPFVKTAMQQLEIGVRGQGLNQVRAMGFLGRPDLFYLGAYSPYAVYHAKYHAFFRELVQTKGYADIWLVSPEGDIIYTYAKRNDFATNLLQATYQDTPPTQLFQDLLANAGTGHVQMTDYVSYPPAGDIPVGFIGAPILDEGKIVGILIYELPLDQINDLMQVHTGFWKTGETYLVGADKLSRTKTRFSKENNFFEQKVDTLVVRKGLLGESGIAIIEDYRGIPVLSAYQALELNRFKWVLLAEVDRSEAFGPSTRMRNLMVGIIFVTTFIAIGVGIYIGRSIAQPIAELAETSTQIASGDLQLRAKSGTRDEIGRLAQAFNIMTDQLQALIVSLEQRVVELNQSSQALRESEERYQSLIRNIQTAIVLHDGQGQLLNCNPLARELLGLSEDQLIGKSLIDPEWHFLREDGTIMPVAEYPVSIVLSSQRALRGYVAGISRPDKDDISWVLANAEPEYDDTGKVSIVIVSFVDITERIKAQKALKRHQEHLEELVAERTAELAVAKEQAESANRSKSDFLARMSHEIRTPLNAVTGLTSIVLKSQLNAEQRDYLNKVQIASNNLLTVINDILDFSKVEAGWLELVRAPFDLDQVLEQLADLFSNQAATKDLELIFAVAPDVPRQLTGDAGRLTQVLTNLVANAIKFAETGEIAVGVEFADPADRQTGQTALKFSVSDTGIGIAADVLPTLFEPFTQVGSYLTRKHEGTGLGLAICRRLVELMGGRIWAQSTPGQGSTFSFTLLVETKQEEKPRFNLPPDLHGLKTLVVDDSATARQVHVDLLESFAFSVSAVDSGEKAIELLRRAAASEPYQLVLMDWKMPGMDGIETATAIRNDPGLDRSPIIILVTAYSRELVQERIDSSAVDTSLLKPIKGPQLFNTIMELFGRAEAAVPRIKTNEAAHRVRLSGRRALVVEDSELNRVVAVALLEAAGLMVETAKNGQVAVDKVTGGMPRGYYDAVLMDIQMPEMDGCEATRRIRQWERQQSESIGQVPVTRLPIIALTAHALKGEKEKCLAAGMDDYLAKPIDEEELHRVLLKWLLPQMSATDIKRQGPTGTAAAFDLEGALKRLGGRKTLYDLMLRKFEPEFGNACDRIRQCLAQGDMITAMRIAHSVKGSAGTIGATFLLEASADLEQAAAAKSKDIKVYTERFGTALKHAVEVISQLLGTEE